MLAESGRGRRWAQLAAGLLVALGATACVTSTDIDDLRERMDGVHRQVVELQRQGTSKQEVAELEASISRQIQTLLKTEADMKVELESLSAQIDSLQGKLDDTSFRLGQLSQQIAAANQELRAARGSEISSEGGSPPPTPGASAAAAANDPEALYQAAYSDYLRGSYDLARAGFEQYLAAFPATDLSDNATYWMAECLYRQSKFAAAIQGYEAVLARFPRSDKVPSALLKKGYAHLELGQRDLGVAQLQKVVRLHPASDEANLAQQRLKGLGVDSAGGRRKN